MALTIGTSRFDARDVRHEELGLSQRKSTLFWRHASWMKVDEATTVYFRERVLGAKE
jgi:hypothetical protein